MEGKDIRLVDMVQIIAASGNPAYRQMVKLQRMQEWTALML
jgi:hypothetical protein